MGYFDAYKHLFCTKINLLTRGTGPAEFALAVLEAVWYQTCDLLETMRGDWQPPANSKTVLRVDGGMVASNCTMQFFADILRTAVNRQQILEKTALGANYLAGLQVGIYPTPNDFSNSWELENCFSSMLDEQQRTKKYAGWQDAVRRTLSREISPCI